MQRLWVKESDRDRDVATTLIYKAISKLSFCWKVNVAIISVCIDQCRCCWCTVYSVRWCEAAATCIVIVCVSISDSCFEKRVFVFLPSDKLGFDAESGVPRSGDLIECKFQSTKQTNKWTETKRERDIERKNWNQNMQ